MNQEFITIDKQKIAYYDNKVNNQALVFVHGNSLSSETFLHQLKDEKFNNSERFRNRLIALYLPSQGNSFITEEPEKIYSSSVSSIHSYGNLF